MGPSTRRPNQNATVDMSYALNTYGQARLPTNRPTYGAGAREAADAQLLNELHARRAARTSVAPARAATATATATAHQASIEGKTQVQTSREAIAARLAEARKHRQALERQLAAAVQREKMLEQQEVVAAEEEKAQKVKSSTRAEKMRRREQALSAARPSGIRKVVRKSKSGGDGLSVKAETHLQATERDD